MDTVSLLAVCTPRTIDTEYLTNADLKYISLLVKSEYRFSLGETPFVNFDISFIFM